MTPAGCSGLFRPVFRRHALAVAAVGAVGLLLAACDRLGSVTPFQSIDVTGAEWGRDFRLLDAEGRTVQLADFKGRCVLLFFGFTQCPDVCPTTLAEMAQAMRELGPRSDKVQVLFVTVDPERDTVTVLRNYMGHFFTKWRAYRTTDAVALTRAEMAFGASHSRAPRRGGGYDVVHSATTYVVDDRGRVVVEWPFGMPKRDIAADLSTILEEDINQ